MLINVEVQEVRVIVAQFAELLLLKAEDPDLNLVICNFVDNLNYR